LGSVTFDLTHHAPRIAKCAIRLFHDVYTLCDFCCGEALVAR